MVLIALVMSVSVNASGIPSSEWSIVGEGMSMIKSMNVPTEFVTRTKHDKANTIVLMEKDAAVCEHTPDYQGQRVLTANFQKITFKTGCFDEFLWFEPINVGGKQFLFDEFREKHVVTIMKEGKPIHFSAMGYIKTMGKLADNVL